MKCRLILYFLLFFVADTLSAQQKNIRLDIGFQRNYPERIFNPNLKRYDNRNSGFGLHICPKWNYSKNISLGINMEYNFVRGYYPKNIAEDAADWHWRLADPVYDIFSFSPTINYYFSENKIKPFVSLGAGAYYFLYRKPLLNAGISSAAGISINKIVNLSIEYKRVFGNTHMANPNIYESYNFSKYILSVKASFSIGLANSKKTEE